MAQTSGGAPESSLLEISVIPKVSLFIFLPEKFRRAVFTQLHGISHPGIKASQELITSRFIWKNMNKDIRDWAKVCIKCQKNKVTRHTQSPLEHFPLPDGRFTSVHVDIVGPLPVSNGYCYSCQLCGMLG